METTIYGLGSWVYVYRPLINKPPPHNRDYNRDPNIKALKRRGFMNQGSTLRVQVLKNPVHETPSTKVSYWGLNMRHMWIIK